MKRVLLTGATGFIGRHCISLLVESGYEVHAVSSRPTGEGRSDVYWHVSDLLDSAQVSRLAGEVRASHLLHFAWYVEPSAYRTSAENLRWVKASLELLHAFSLNGGERVVMAGTCAEYDWGGDRYSEHATPLSPATLYGVCKHSLRLMLEAYARDYSLSAAWGRIFFPYGPHEHPSKLIASTIRSLLQDQPARCSHGNQIRDFLYVQDVADGFVALLGSAVQGPVNIASGSPVAIKDVIYKIAGKLNRRELVELGALFAPEGEPPSLVADVARLKNEVGWTPRHDLDEGIDRAIDWWNTYLDHYIKVGSGSNF